MKKVLVTGATGFVGRHLVELLTTLDIEIYAVVRNEEKAKSFLGQLKNVHIVCCPLNFYAHMSEKISTRDIDVAYHFAWEGSAGPNRADTWMQLQNAQHNVEFLRAMKEIGCKRVVCAGTIMEHEVIAACYKDGNRPGPGYIYGSGKLVAHTMCMSVAAQIGLDLIWAEITNAYGAGEKSARMVNTTIRKIIRGETPQFTAGTQNYDFVYIDDAVMAFYLIGQKGKPFHNYLIGSGQARPLKEFLLEMQASIAADLPFVFGDVPYTGTDIPIEKFSCQKATDELGYVPQVSFAEGVKKTMNWLMENKDDNEV